MEYHISGKIQRVLCGYFRKKVLVKTVILNLTQSEARDLLAVLVQYEEEDVWVELVVAGAVHAPERPLIPAIPFNLLACLDANAERDFRFPVRGILRLVMLLRLTAVVVTERGDRCLVEETMCILMYRLSYPRRLHDMESEFGQASCALSSIFLRMVDIVDSKVEANLYFHKRLISERIDLYCTAISARAPVTGVLAFPDGTKISICRPSARARRRAENLQAQVYSGRKRIHCIIYQGLTAPDGLCIHFWGPYEGRRHDSIVFAASKLLAYFEENNHIFAGKAIFGTQRTH
ncbi:hypothetical protein PF011_g2843 [Phytophthora fragariae]|uniref:DDE Tnp4 domain-containing protein n=1 Tax=Phytophthora fragariae TaxID=53985 RepID=A0A6A3MCE0_9STRA|nr:hypothetical protein PF011_g2843 [Phytophthora fragariae]